MTSLPPLTPAQAASSWTPDVPMLILAVALVGTYGWGVVRVRRAGSRWPAGRLAAFVLLGVGSLVISTMSCLATYRPVLFWPAALGNTVLTVLAPLGLALGNPLTLVRTAWPGRVGPWLWARAHGPLARVATFPLVSIVIGVAGPFALYFTGYFTATLAHPVVRELAWMQLLVTGLLFVVPLMTEELLPTWCTWPVRAALAFADGLADALPGMVIALTGTVLSPWYAQHPRSWGPTVHWDQTIGGTLVLTVTEAVGAPFLVAVFVAWARADAREAQAIDAALDASEARDSVAAASRQPLSSSQAEPGVQRPWWETDPGALRGRRYDR